MYAKTDATIPAMELQGWLIIVLTNTGTQLCVSSGLHSWVASFASRPEAITAAFLCNMVNSEEAGEALAANPCAGPWCKEVRVSESQLLYMGFICVSGARSQA